MALNTILRVEDSKSTSIGESMSLPGFVRING